MRFRSLLAAPVLAVLLSGSGNSGTIEVDAAPEAERQRVLPFGVGEKIDYRVRYGVVPMNGRASMEVVGVERLRGTPAYKVVMHVQGKPLGLINYNATLTSWMDSTTLNSLQFYNESEQTGRDDRLRRYEIFPDRKTFRARGTPDTMPELPSVADALDEASFLYFIRTIPLEVGKTYEFNRYFRPDRNPVIVKVVGKEKVKVPLAEFPAIIIEPVIKAKGLFAEGGEARIWLSDDAARLILRIDSKAYGLATLRLEMTGYTPPKR